MLDVRVPGLTRWLPSCVALELCSHTLPAVQISPNRVGVVRHYNTTCDDDFDIALTLAVGLGVI